MKNEVKFKNLEYTSHSQASTEMKMSLLGLFKLLLKYSLWKSLCLRCLKEALDAVFKESDCLSFQQLKSLALKAHS